MKRVVSILLVTFGLWSCRQEGPIQPSLHPSEGGLASRFASQPSWDLKGDFSTTQNPAGPWEYGYQTSTPAFFLFGTSSNILGFDAWTSAALGRVPTFQRNTSGAPVQDGVPRGDVSLHGGCLNNESAFVAFTAPSEGMYQTTYSFRAGDVGETSALIIRNFLFSDQLASHPLTSINPSGVLNVYLNTGESMQFIVATLGSCQGDNTPTDVTIVRTNGAPIPSAGGPYLGVEGSAVLLSGAGSTDPDNDPLTYNWGFGDASSGSGVAPVHTYADNGSYLVTVDVSDGVFVKQSTTTATIGNAPPSVTLFLQTAPPIHAGQSFVVRGGFNDAGVNDGPWAYRFFRDATLLQQGTKPNQPPPGGTQPVTLKINTVGAHTLMLEVTDKDGGVASKSIQVQILP